MKTLFLKTIVLAIIFHLSLTKGSAQVRDKNSAEEHTIETIRTSEYSINYPSNWVADTSKKMGTSFTLQSPLTGAIDLFAENVNLLIQDLSAYDFDLDSYSELSLNQIKTQVEDGKIELSERKSKDGQSFHHVIYSGKYSVYKLKWEQYYWVIDKKAYVLTFTTEQRHYERYKDVGRSILDSFRLK